MSAIDGSLRRLGTDYVDLYQTHRWDDAAPTEKTLAAIEDAVAATTVQLFEDEIARLEAPYRPHEVLPKE